MAEDRDHVAALTLLRDALRLSSTATALVEADYDSPDTLDAAGAFEELERSAAVSPREFPDFDLVRRALTETDPAALDAWSGKELRRARLRAAKLLRVLEKSFEPRSVRRLQLLRAARIAACVLLPATAAVLVFQLALAPVNIARDKPVIASSSAAGRSATGAADGIIDEHCGVRTADEKFPWVRVDLLEHRPLHSLLVYPAKELPEVPLVVEISADGDNFREVARRETPLTAGLRWRLALNDTVARYIRVRVLKEPAHLCLAEIEVFAKRKR